MNDLLTNVFRSEILTSCHVMLLHSETTKSSSMCIILIPYGHSIKLFEWNDGPGECVGEDVDSGGGGVGGGQVDDDNANIAHCHLE